MSNLGKANEIITSSGNNFHARVARWFSDNGWLVQVSPYYMDQGLSKAREIDLIVEKTVGEITSLSGNFLGDIVARLYVECKFVPLTSVFWFAEKNIAKAESLVCKDGLFRPNNTYTNNHHYLSGDSHVAKLFASSKDKLQENEPFYRALNQVLNGMISMKGLPVSIPEIANRPGGKLVLLEYPVVVCNSFENVFRVGFLEESEPENINDNFQLEVEYAFVDRNQNHVQEYFLIDFIDVDKLEGFSNLLKNDADSAKVSASET